MFSELNRARQRGGSLPRLPAFAAGNSFAMGQSFLSRHSVTRWVGTKELFNIQVSPYADRTT